MFIELNHPNVIDIYRTRDRSKIRIAEPGASRQMTVNLTFENDDQVRTFIAALTAAVEKEGPKE